MGRPPRSEARDTRQAILDAALDLFSARGFYGASMRDIARAVGIRDSAIYHYFPSKEALFDAITAERMESRQAVLAFLREPVTDLADFFERLTGLILEQLQHPRDRKLFRILLSDGLRLHAAGRLDFIERSGIPRLAALMDRLAREGWLSPGIPMLRALQFVAPLLLWNVVDSTRPPPAAPSDHGAFIRSHVAQFLRGAQSTKTHHQRRKS